MLEDDELDFDDFGDLEGYEGQTLSTEELEKQLALEFDDLTEAKTEEVVSTELDEGEIVEDPVEKKISKSTETTQAKTVTKPSGAPLKPFQKQQQNYYNNNFYNQQQYTPDMMAMNMFPYPQYSNRIYVNPKFNNGAQVNQQQILQQQQMAQQRQFMEMEAKRMALLQHQQQLLMHKSRAAELDQKRRETAEMMRKRKELKETNGNNEKAGEKRKVEHSSPEPERDAKRILRPSPAGGISIKGAAAAAAARGTYPSSTPPSSPSRNTPYTPPHLKRPENNIRNRIGQTQAPSITSRLGRPEEKKPTISSSPISQVVPIVTGGKSNTLAINGFKDEIKEVDIKNMTKDIPGGAQDIRINQDTKTAIVVFPSIEAAVTFRRKFNRFQIGEARINVVFQK